MTATAPPARLSHYVVATVRRDVPLQHLYVGPDGWTDLDGACRFATKTSAAVSTSLLSDVAVHAVWVERADPGPWFARSPHVTLLLDDGHDAIPAGRIDSADAIADVIAHIDRDVTAIVLDESRDSIVLARPEAGWTAEAIACDLVDQNDLYD